MLIFSVSHALGEEPMQCDIGPIDKEYGGTKWFVYSCPDDKTLVIYSYPDNPASPFYFMFYPKEGEYQLYGEGTGDKKYNQAASDELRTLTEKDIKAIIAQTKKPLKNEGSPN